MNNMLNYALSFIFSAIDFSALIILTLCTFRYRLKHHTKEIIYTSLIMGLISKIFMITHIDSVAPILQLIILILIFKYIFKESLLYSFLSNVLGFMLFMTIEFTLVQILIEYNLISLSNLGGQPNATTYECTIAESVIMYIVAFGMKNLNQGFGFKESTDRKIKTRNIYFILTSSFSVSVLVIIFYLVLTHQKTIYITISAAILLTLTSILIYLFNKRDKEFYQ